MKRTMYPVDVLSVCSAGGEMRPIRLRLEQEREETICIHIEEVLKVTDISHVGVEAKLFLCRAKTCGREILVELKYTFRSHSWTLLRRVT